jgi:hypothetical protein
MASTALAAIETDATGTTGEQVCTGGPQADGCVYCSGPETD